MILKTYNVYKYNIQHIMVVNNIQDINISINTDKLKSLDIIIKPKEHKNKITKGAFFPYYNETSLNLIRYQIKTNTQDSSDNNILKENSIIYAFRLLGMDDNDLIRCSNYVNNRHIAQGELKELAKELKINIVLRSLRKDNNVIHKSQYGDKEGKTYNIALHSNHYFIYDEHTEYSSFYVNNYRKLENERDAQNIIGYRTGTTNFRKDKRPMYYISSLHLVDELVKSNDNLVIPITNQNINLYDEEFDYKDDDNIFEDFLENNYNDILNETFNISNNNDDICDINDDTIIASLRYNNIRDIKEDIKYCINYTSHLKDIKLKKYLEDFLFENHYKMIFKSGSLTDRFKNINSNICYNSIYRNIFNNNYNNTIKKYNILPLKCSNIVKLLHSIDPSITGSFIDYLIRRIICELLNIEFDDSRASRRLDNTYDTNTKKYYNVDHICNSEDCRYSIEFEYQDEVEVFKKICTLPYCRLHSYNLTKLTNIYKTQDIIKEIFITSLSHCEAFGVCPNQDNVNRILEILSSNLFDLYTPLMILCKNIIKNKETIKLNPAFGGKLKSPVDNYNIPSDADLIINDCLIDIKCTKNKSNSKCCEILQLLGYSALSSFHTDNNKKINKIMILNILEGSIYKIDISNITDKNYENYIKFLCNEL